MSEKRLVKVLNGIADMIDPRVLVCRDRGN